MSSKERLLSDDSEFQSELDNEELLHIRPVKKDRSRLYTIVPSILLFLSVLLNFGQSYYVAKLRRKPDCCQSKYSGLGYDTKMVYEGGMSPWTNNDSHADALWAGMKTDYVTVALHKDYVQEKNLPPADTFPWDDDKSLYYVKVWHDLHCLKLMRQYAMDLTRGIETDIRWGHFSHCLNGLRQDIMCRADDTPMPGVPGKDGGLGQGQELQCRDINALAAWTQEEERNACFQMVTMLDTPHTLERFAFCPEDSPYREVQVAYFEKWGHESLP